MIIFLAGLQGVSEELYDAAKVDGAGRWARLRHITLPMITPTIFFNLVLGIIAALQVFTSALVATEGGPAYATWFYALHIYKQAFGFFNMGYASALAWLLAVLVIALTAVQMRLARSWVYYAAENE
jgi:ABC-type sugar transport system permease subunit